MTGFISSRPNGSLHRRRAEQRPVGEHRLRCQQRSGLPLGCQVQLVGLDRPRCHLPEIAAASARSAPTCCSGDDTDPAAPGFQGDTSRISSTGASRRATARPTAFTLEPRRRRHVDREAWRYCRLSGAFTEVHVHGTGRRRHADRRRGAAGRSCRRRPALTGAGGNDLLVIDDASAGRRRELHAARRARSTAASAATRASHATTEKVEVRGGSGADTFDVTPSRGHDLRRARQRPDDGAGRHAYVPLNHAVRRRGRRRAGPTASGPTRASSRCVHRDRGRARPRYRRCRRRRPADGHGRRDTRPGRAIADSISPMRRGCGSGPTASPAAAGASGRSRA